MGTLEIYTKAEFGFITCTIYYFLAAGIYWVSIEVFTLHVNIVAEVAYIQEETNNKFCCLYW